MGDRFPPSSFKPINETDNVPCMIVTEPRFLSCATRAASRLEDNAIIVPPSRTTLTHKTVLDTFRLSFCTKEFFFIILNEFCAGEPQRPFQVKNEVVSWKIMEAQVVHALTNLVLLYGHKEVRLTRSVLCIGTPEPSATTFAAQILRNTISKFRCLLL